MKNLKVSKLFLFLAIQFLFTCKNPKHVDLVIGKQLDEKLAELQSKKLHLTDLGAKYNSNNFLLDNIYYHNYLLGERSNAYLKCITNFVKNDDKLIKELDSVKKLQLIDTRHFDLQSIDSAYLIKNEQEVVSILNQCSWKERITPEIFNNYLLPYRISTEMLTKESWRSYFKNLFFKNTDSLLLSLNLEEAAAWVHYWLYKRKKDFKILPSNQLDLPNLPITKLDELNIGTCNELTIIGAAAMRSLGIPSGVDFAPAYLNLGLGHEWNFIVTGPKNFIPFDVTTSVLFRYKQPKDIICKVYRKLYKFNKNSHFNLYGYIDGLPDFINDPFNYDITNQYTKTTNIRVERININRNHQRCYLSVFNLGNWRIVDWGKVTDSYLNFNNLGKGGIYLTQYYDDNGKEPASWPFLLDNKGNIKYFQPNKNKLVSLTLKRKFPMSERKELFIKKTIGGRFEGSNDSLFKNSTTLYEIKNNPGDQFNEIKIPSVQSFRFVRYISPKNGFGNMAEIKFYLDKFDADTNYLKGKVIGTIDSIDAFTKRTAAFDNNPNTFFATNNPDLSWAGLDLGRPKNIEKIKFLVRNDMNSIQIGNEYELYYWDNTWISLGRVKAQKTSITFNKIPDNAVLWLKCYSGGTEERIFTFSNNKISWW